MKFINLKLKLMGVPGMIIKIDMGLIMVMVGSLNQRKNAFITLGITVDLKIWQLNI